MISVLRSLESKLKTDTKQAHSKNDRRHGHEESWGVGSRNRICKGPGVGTKFGANGKQRGRLMECGGRNGARDAVRVVGRGQFIQGLKYMRRS